MMLQQTLRPETKYNYIDLAMAQTKQLIDGNTMKTDMQATQPWR